MPRKRSRYICGQYAENDLRYINHLFVLTAYMLMQTVELFDLLRIINLNPVIFPFTEQSPLNYIIVNAACLYLIWAKM